VEDMRGEEKDSLAQASYLRMKQSFQQALNEEEVKRLDEASRLVGLTGVARRSNKEWIMKLDNALVQGCGFGLSHFEPRRRLGALGQGDRRYLTKVVPPGEDQEVLRSCIAFAKGGQAFEVPRVIVAGQRVHPVLHLAPDQGSIGLPAIMWPLQSHSTAMLLKHGNRATTLRSSFVTQAQARTNKFDATCFLGACFRAGHGPPGLTHV